MRFEFKYLVPMAQYGALRNALQPFLQADRFAMQQTDGRYTVRSIYFDTPGFEMYQTKINGIAHRLKVRLRGYNQGNDDSLVFMEIKRKYEGPILKNRSDTRFEVVKKNCFQAHHLTNWPIRSRIRIMPAAFFTSY